MAVEIKKRWMTEKSLIKAWIELGRANGDVYRRYLINPVIHGLLASPNSANAPSPIHDALAKWYGRYCKEGEASGEECEPPSDEWYDALQSMTVNVNSVLDLGCGEAYRGRWLSKASVKYVGVDVSKLLLASALAEKRFECFVADLDTPKPLEGIWREAVPPDLVLAITLLDQLEHPEYLLADIAALYKTRHTGKMLVVTCNPEFYGHTGEGKQPVAARIATIDGDDGGVAYLRSRQSLRKLFRDAGMHVVDEASLQLPARLAKLRGFDSANLNLSQSPFVFWLLEMHSTKRDMVKPQQLEEWLASLGTESSQSEVVQAILQSLQPEAKQLHWRRFQKDQIVVRRHNIGGRLFVVRNGTFEVEVRGAADPEREAGERKRWRFRQNEIFGELEAEHDATRRVRRYSASVVATQTGPMGHAEALEVPASVTHEVLRSSALLGNPFFNALRRKVLEGLLRYDSSWVQKSTANPLVNDLRLGDLMKRQRISESEDLFKLSVGHTMAIASLLLQGLEGERERATIDHSTYRLVLVAQMRSALSEVTGRPIKKIDEEMAAFNRSIRFLASAGVLRMMKAGGGQNAEKSLGGKQAGTSILMKAKLIAEEWVGELDRWQRKALNQLMSQSAGLFLIDDELALRRLVMEPSLELVEDLVRRVRIFSPQPADVEHAREADLASAVEEGVRRRFASDHWRTDSLGQSLDGMEALP